MRLSQSSSSQGDADFVAEKTLSNYPTKERSMHLPTPILGQTSIGSKTTLVGFRSDRCQGSFAKVLAVAEPILKALNEPRPELADT